MRVYKDGNVADASKDQLDALMAAGWSRTPEAPKTKTPKKIEVGTDEEESKSSSKSSKPVRKLLSKE